MFYLTGLHHQANHPSKQPAEVHREKENVPCLPTNKVETATIYALRVRGVTEIDDQSHNNEPACESNHSTLRRPQVNYASFARVPEMTHGFAGPIFGALQIFQHWKYVLATRKWFFGHFVYLGLLNMHPLFLKYLKYHLTLSKTSREKKLSGVPRLVSASTSAGRLRRPTLTATASMNFSLDLLLPLSNRFNTIL